MIEFRSLEDSVLLHFEESVKIVNDILILLSVSFFYFGGYQHISSLLSHTVQQSAYLASFTFLRQSRGNPVLLKPTSPLVWLLKIKRLRTL